MTLDEQPEPRMWNPDEDPPPALVTDTKVGHTLTLDTEKSERGLAMSEQQYERIQSRIGDGVSKGSATSIWLALAFAFIGFAASAVLALVTLDPSVVSATVRGRLQAGAVGAGVAAALCLLAHGSKWLKDRKNAHDICHEMDIYCHREKPRARTRRKEAGQTR